MEGLADLIDALEEVGPGARETATRFLQAMIDAPERERVMSLIASGRERTK